MVWRNVFAVRISEEARNGKDVKENQIKEREDVLNMIRENPYITAKKVAERANISLSGANYRMRMLKKEGKICFEGKGGKGKWVVIENDL